MIVQIKDTDTDNLSISYFEDEGVVMLFTPNMDDKMEHFHIELNPKEVWELKKFLIELGKGQIQ